MHSSATRPSVDSIVFMNDLVTDPGLLENCWRFFVLGVLQGITEFVPISSTAHLKAVPLILGWGDPGISIIAVIQLGSIFAVIAYFWHDLKDSTKGIALAFRRGQWREKNARLGVAISLGTIPILMAGIFIKLFWQDFETSALRSIPSIALTSIAMAYFLGFAERKGAQKKSIEKVTGKDGLIVGLGQMLALIPGISRSGVTFTTALIDGWKRQEAARFSFLLGVPAISIAGLVELKNAFHGSNSTEILPLIIGILSAAIASWLSIDWLLKYLHTHSSWIFVTYRLMFGIFLLLWWWGISSR